MTTIQKTLKERLKGGGTVLGTWNGIPSPSLVNAIGCSGMDFVVIDTEHGPASVETAENLVRAAEVAQMTPIVRVPSNDPHLILRTLDIGAYGIQVPHVSTKEDAQKVVRASKYHPLGDRGYSPFTRAGKFGTASEGHAERSNKETLVVLNIEGVEGLDNLEEITAVEGVDVIFIGPYDLSQSLGKPGNVFDSEVVEYIRKAAQVVKNKGLACGSFACDLRYLDILMDCGVQYVTYMVDCAFISQAYKDICEKFFQKKGEKKI